MRYLPKHIRKARHAAIAVQVALTLTVMLGMLAIVVDGGLLLAQRRQMQAVADAAALAAAAAKANGESDTTAQASALAIAAANGAANDGTYSLITPNTKDGSGNPLHGIWFPPTSGNFVGKAGTTGYAAGYVEVVVEYDQVRLFSAFWGTSTLPVRARAVAQWSGAVSYWDATILALGISGLDLNDGGSSQITVPGPIIVNSNMSVNGNGWITSTSGPINYVGTANSTHYTPTPTKVGSITPDPLASLALPDPTSLTLQSSSAMTITSNLTLQPGVYQGGITVKNGAVVTLASGIYYLEGGGLSIQNTASTVKGTEVLIYNGETNGTTNNPSSVGSISVQANSVLQLTPMSSGTWQGISIFQDRNATAAMGLQGGSGTDVTGMVYAAASDVTIQGGSNYFPARSFIIKTLSVQGNSSFSIPDATVKVPLPGTGPGQVGLVE